MVMGIQLSDGSERHGNQYLSFPGWNPQRLRRKTAVPGQQQQLQHTGHASITGDASEQPQLTPQEEFIRSPQASPAPNATPQTRPH